MIKYPYLPKGKKIEYVNRDNEFMKIAEEFAVQYKGSLKQCTAAVIVKNGKIISKGSVGEGYHFKNGCERIKHNMPTGEGYDLCPGCSNDNHAEARAIIKAKEKNINIKDSDLYLWGHWWCCESCWNYMIDAGIKNVYLLKSSEILFNKSHPENILSL